VRRFLWVFFCGLAGCSCVYLGALFAYFNKVFLLIKKKIVERERHGGELLWILNLAGLGVGGVLLTPLGHMGWGYERILEGGGGCFLVIPDLSRKMAPRSNFGMICGVGRWPLRKCSWSYIALLVRRILLLQFTWIFLVVPFSRM
jgi:hypothetical protein